MAGLTYRKIGLGDATMYVNSDAGYLVAPEDIAAEFTDGHLSLNCDQHSNLYAKEQTDRDIAAA
jgi:hypothetical protein